MLDITIKYFFICNCSLYLYTKLLNIHASKKATISSIIFSLCFSGIFAFIRTYITFLSIIILIGLFLCFVSIVFRNSFNISVFTSVISLGMGFFGYFLSSILIIPMGYIIIVLRGQSPVFDTILLILSGLMENILVRIPFRLKRLKNGMPFLLDKGSSDVGVFISISVLLSFSFYFEENQNHIYLLILFLTISAGLIIFFWWRKKLYRDYLKKLNENETYKLLQTIDNQSEEIDKLKAHNAELSKIIHKDNKLIPAMQIAVKDLLESSETDYDNSSNLLTQLNQLYNERNAVLHVYEVSSKPTPKTGVLSIDAVIKYLSNRSTTAETSFDVTITGSIKYFVSEIIDESDLNTLISDLTENSIIAVQKESQKYVLLNLGIDENNYYRIDVFDSGSPFSVNVLKNMGRQRITTHAETGGSGIGLMTTFEILKKYDASFLIDENIQHNLYTKRVSVIFDKQKHIDVFRVDTTNDA